VKDARLGNDFILFLHLNTLHNVEFSSGPTNLQFKQTFSESSVAGLTVAPLEDGYELFIVWTGGIPSTISMLQSLLLSFDQQR
jgi:hypothetical protein